MAVLFKENLQFEIINSDTDLDGRILKCIIQIEKQISQLTNIYAPTNPKNKQIFYQKLPKFLEKGNNTILAGDFNMIEDIFLDKLGGNTSNTHLTGLNKLTEIKNEHKLVDIWRKTNPSKRHFIYHNADKTIHSRLDRIYISKAIKTKTCKINPISLSDHDSVSVILQISKENPRGPDIGKLNTSTLKQKKFQEIFKNFWNFRQHKKKEYKNHNDWWDAGKLYFKTIAIDYCTRRNKQINKKQQELIHYISQEKSKLNPNIEQINKYQQELNDIENYKNEGTIIRSKEKTILNEEKPTKYFYSKEKQKQTKKHLTRLLDDKGKVLLKNTEILT